MDGWVRLYRAIGGAVGLRIGEDGPESYGRGGPSRRAGPSSGGRRSRDADYERLMIEAQVDGAHLPAPRLMDQMRNRLRVRHCK